MKLTVAQAEVIHDLANLGCTDGIPFTPLGVFPERNNKDNASRRVLRNLAKKKVIETVQRPDPQNPSVLMDKYILGQTALDFLFRHYPEDDEDDEEEREICPYCNGTDISPYERDGGSCPHCFGGYVR